MNKPQEPRHEYVCGMQAEELPTVHESYRPSEIKDLLRMTLMQEVHYGPDIPHTD